MSTPTPPSLVCDVREFFIDVRIPAALAAADLTNVGVEHGPPGNQLPDRLVTVQEAKNITHADKPMPRQVRGSIDEEFDLTIVVSVLAGDQSSAGNRAAARAAWAIAGAIDDDLRADAHLGRQVRSALVTSYDERPLKLAEGIAWDIEMTVHVVVRV